jgi:ATP-dependent DNA helicase DinG
MTKPDQSLADRAEDELKRVVAGLPNGGEARPGQVEMARRVADSAQSGQHLIVRAGTGTGKTLGYLVPAILSGKRVVVATATKALQDQLATKDLPFLRTHLEEPFSWAVLKGRANYICKQRLTEVQEQRLPGNQLELDGLAERANRDQLGQILKWAATTRSGDRAELSEEPSEATWAAVSTTSRDCPGASKCPSGENCFAEAARAVASAADVIVVNLYLYGLHLASGGVILPEHDLVVMDEAHVLDDVISATCGLEIGPGRLSNLARMVRGLIANEDGTASGDLDTIDQQLVKALGPYRGERLRLPLADELLTALMAIRERVASAQARLGKLPDLPDSNKAKATRARLAATALLDDLDTVSQATDTHVVWVEGAEHSPTLRLAPVDIAGLLQDTLWNDGSAVLTSATIAPGLGRQLGLPAESETPVDVGSPFDFERNGLIYCAVSLPPPKAPAWGDAVIDELETLIKAAEGRTLALFTSYKAMGRAVEALSERLPYTVLAQGDLPKAKLVSQFTDEPETCLFATMSFWQGIDVPGPSLSLVTIDKLPFPRPNEPLLEARRERVGDGAFMEIDVPRAATMLAQGIGRLIRSATDKGAVAVLDPRLATARYGPKIVGALPRMRRTRDQDEIVAFLRALRD